MDVDEPSESGRAARSQEGSNAVGMLICATTESQSKQDCIMAYLVLQVLEQCLIRLSSTCLLDCSMCNDLT